MGIKTHKDLEVWKLSMDLVEKIYRETKTFPNEEIYGLVSQLRRTSISIPSNIAEGAARNSNKDNLRFLYISLGSLSELETQIMISKRLNYLNDLSILTDIEKIRRMMLNLIKFLKNQLKSE